MRRIVLTALALALGASASAAHLGSVSWGAQSIYEADGAVCVNLDGGFSDSGILTSDPVPSCAGQACGVASFSVSASLATTAPANASTSVQLIGSTDATPSASGVWNAYPNTSAAVVALDGGAQTHGWIQSQGTVMPWTEVQVTGSADGGILCVTYSAP